MKVDVVVIAAQGCSHATTVIGAVSDQLNAGEELFILEDQDCGHSETTLPSGARVRHVGAGLLHDIDLTAAGIGLASAKAKQSDVILTLEDHGVPDPGFMQNLRAFFEDNRRQGTTFYLRNGTSSDIPSRALFSYVGGLADIDGKNKRIEPVTSSFAIRRSAIDSQLLRDITLAENYGRLNYQVLPELMLDSINQPPRSLTLTHHQKNSFHNATSAIYWNARTNGAIDRSQVSFTHGILRTPVKYLGRSFRVMRARPNTLPTSALITWLGVAGFAGWWVGRYAGDEDSAQKLVQAHPSAAHGE
jgi:hypothetical protein